MKRLIVLFLALCLIAGLCACAGPAAVPTEAPQDTPTESPVTEDPATDAPATETPGEEEPEETPVPEQQQETVEFTDDTGRTLTIPAEISKIAVSGPLSQIILFSLAPDQLVGISNSWDPGAERYFDPKYYNLPVLGQLYGGKGELNLEELLAAAPQIVFDVGEAKSSIGEDLDALTEQTGIPFIHIDASTTTMGDAYRKLGALLGLEAQAEELASYCESIITMVNDTMNAVGEDRAKILYLLGDEGLNVIAKGSYHGEIFDMVADNAAVLDDPSSRGTGNETDMEQIMLWDPEFIIFSSDSIGDSVGDDPLWQQLTAIKEGNYAIAPYGPYNWMGFPPSVQRNLGILWLIKTLYPEQTSYDMYTETNAFYEMFFHCSLTEADYQQILG